MMKRINLLFAVMTTMLFLSGLTFAQSRYFQFGNLNNGPTNVGTAWKKLDTTPGSHTFTKTGNNTTIEVFVNSRFSVGSLTGNGIRFQVRIDDKVADFENQGSLLSDDKSDFLSILGVFKNLGTGPHTVSIWAAAGTGGSASNVIVDPGGWNGKIIVKETL